MFDFLLVSRSKDFSLQALFVFVFFCFRFLSFYSPTAWTSTSVRYLSQTRKSTVCWALCDGPFINGSKWARLGILTGGFILDVDPITLTCGYLNGTKLIPPGTRWAVCWTGHFNFTIVCFIIMHWYNNKNLDYLPTRPHQIRSPTLTCCALCLFLDEYFFPGRGFISRK